MVMAKNEDAIVHEARPGAKMLIDAAHTIEERGRTYGSPKPNHIRIARFFMACLADKLKPGVTITPGDVVRMMIGLKLARLMETPNHADSCLDLAGYAAIHLEIEADV